MTATDELDTPNFKVVEPMKAKKKPKLTKKFYEKELRRLQQELVKLQEWIKLKGLRVVVIFEGRERGRQGWCHQADRGANQPPRRASRRPRDGHGT